MASSELLFQGLLLALPVAVLVTLIALLWGKRKSRKYADLQMPMRSSHTYHHAADSMAGEAGQPLANASLFKHPSHFKVPLETQAPAPVAPPNAAPAGHDAGRDAAGPSSPAAAGQQQVSGAQSDPLKLLDAGAAAATGDGAAAAQVSPTADLERRIAEAEEQGGGPTLAPMFLELAVLHANASNEPQRLAALRSAAGFGARFGPRAAHALARLHLAEVCYASGDLHGACEHWQLARMAYHDDGNKPEFNRVDRMMLSHGCPTDWVLTDF